MLSGYGVSGINSINGEETYTNFKIVSSWLNAVYGKTWQIGAFVGLSQNLGTNKNLLTNNAGDFTAYGCGYSNDTQILLDRLYRISPHASYNLPNFNLGIEYRVTKIFSAFVNLNNFGTTQYYNWYNYPSQRFNLLAGLTYAF